VKSGGPFIVAIDGPAGAGKSTVSKVLARRLGFSLVDTGAIYRGAALVALEHGIETGENNRLRELLERMRLEFQPLADENRVFLDGRDVSDRIRTPEVSMAASRISADPSVRQALLPLQRRLALQAKRGSVLEGRYSGTVVFPDADVKFFLDAAPEVRAKRRREELLKKGIARPLEEVLAEQAKRDRDDSTRQVAPLRAATDSLMVDSSKLSISEVVARMEKIIRDRWAEKGGT